MILFYYLYCEISSDSGGDYEIGILDPTVSEDTKHKI